MKNKILMLAPSVFGYDKILFDSLKQLIPNSYTFNERPSNSFIVKAGLRLNNKLLNFLITFFYYMKIRKFVEKNKIEMVLIINPEAVPIWFLKFLNENNKNVVLYFWDSFKNKPRNKLLLPYATKAWSFDPSDCQFFNMSYKSLFYSKKSITNPIPKYKVVFIGTLHSDRYDLVTKIFENFDKNEVYKFFYCPSKLLFIYKKYIKREWLNINIKDVAFKPLSYSESMKVFSQSCSVLDIHSDGQNGLTMRSIEVLGQGQKLITTNRNIINEPFYDEKFIFYFDRDLPHRINHTTLKNFSDTNHSRVTINIDNNYVDNWLKDILMLSD